MLDVVLSKNNVPIRINEERWFHIIENHDDLAGYYNNILATVESPDYVIEGDKKAFIALKVMKKRKFLAVVYREVSKNDGFIITAFFSSNIKLENEVIVWQRNSQEKKS